MVPRLVRRSPVIWLLIAAVVGAAGAGVFASPAGADAVSPSGACVGTAAWKAAAFTRVSTGLGPDDIVEIPRADQVEWSGKVVGPAAGSPRAVDGRVVLDLPPMLGSITLGAWSGEATTVEKSGTYAYDLPSFVPAGVKLDLVGQHDEGGTRYCTAVVVLMIAGGPFDSPLIWVALVGLLLFGTAVALLGRTPAGGPGAGRLVAGAFMGLPFGLFLGLTLVLFGVIPLASPLVTILLGLGPVSGALWARWSPLRRGREPGMAEQTRLT